MQSRSIYFTFLALLFGLTTPIQLAFAYTIAPLVIDLDLEQRSIVEETITITNTGSGVLRLYATVNEVSLDEGGTVQDFVQPVMSDRTTSITAWLQISRGRMEIPPGETRQVPLSIRVNPEAKPGDYHAFVGFGTGSNKAAAEKQVQNGRAPGVLVRIAIDKKQDKFLRLASFVIDRFVTKPGTEVLSYTIANPGNTEVVPSGEIIFYDNSGTEVGTIPVNPNGSAVAGAKDLTFTSAVPSELSLGKYKAFLSIEYGEHLTASIHDTAFFYILPLQQLIIIFVGVLFVAVLVAIVVHRRLGLGIPEDDADDVAMYIRSERSESKEHDIDLSKKS